MMKREISKIKKQALEDNIPIIRDDTLEAIKEIFLKEKPRTILEIGTGTRLFCYLLLFYL